MKPEIRELNPNDLETLRELNQEVFNSDKDNIDGLDLDWPDSKTGTLYYTQVVNKDGTVGFIAEIGNKPVGYIALCTRDLGYRTKKFVEVENMGVKPQFRSQGIGTILLNKATEWAKSQGADKLLVEAFAKNTKGLDFYRQFGFEESAVTLEKDI